MKGVYKKLKKTLKYIFRLISNNKNKIFVYLFLGTCLYFRLKYRPKLVLSSEFMTALDRNEISNLITLDNKIVLYDSIKGYKYMSHYFIQNMDAFNYDLKQKNIGFTNYSDAYAWLYNPDTHIYSLLGSIVLNSIVTIKDYFKQMSMKKKLTLTEGKNENIFNNFIAKKETIDSLNLIIEQVKQNTITSNLIKPIKGVLLYGKPGTGKTLIAKCLENLNSINFIPSCASDFVEIFVGSGPKKVRELFERARSEKPSIIFIDELEAIGLQRSSNYGSYTNNVERFSTLNQLLSEMDGLNDMDNIIVIAATNREDLLDAALVRPGRFDMKIFIDVPDDDVKFDLYLHYLKKYGYSSDIDNQLLKRIVSFSENFSGAIIENIVNEAARYSYANKSKVIGKTEFENSHQKNRLEFIKFRQYEINR